MKVSQNISQFVEEFNKLENHLRRKGGYSSYDSIASIISKESINNPVIRQYKDDLDSFRELRNALTHQQGVYAEPFAEPYPATVQRLVKIANNIANPPKASSVAVKQVASVRREDNLLDALRMMRDSGFSTLPVIDDGVVEAVLSEYSLLKWYASEASDDGATLVAKQISDISNYLDSPTDIDPNNTYLFVSRNAPLSTIASVFEQAVSDGVRLNAIFVTEHGKASERIQGLITAWDIAIANQM